MDIIILTKAFAKFLGFRIESLIYWVSKLLSTLYRVDSNLKLCKATNLASGILTSVWYGSAADKFGRKPIVVLSSVGELASVIWLMSIGGVYSNEN